MEEYARHRETIDGQAWLGFNPARSKVSTQRVRWEDALDWHNEEPESVPKKIGGKPNPLYQPGAARMWQQRSEQVNARFAEIVCYRVLRCHPDDYPGRHGDMMSRFSGVTQPKDGETRREKRARVLQAISELTPEDLQAAGGGNRLPPVSGQIGLGESCGHPSATL